MISKTWIVVIALSIALASSVGLEYLLRWLKIPHFRRDYFRLPVVSALPGIFAVAAGYFLMPSCTARYIVMGIGLILALTELIVHGGKKDTTWASPEKPSS